MESVTQRKSRKPNLSEEVVLATRVSGFQRPEFAALATDLQPLAFYQDNISLFNVAYLNPIANGSLSKYHFILQEERIRENDTLFVLSFSPRPQKNFDGLKGLLYVSSNQYALQNVIAEPNQKAKINIKIQQQYQLLPGNHWFPEQLSYSISADGYPNANIGLYSEGKTYLKDISINPHLTAKEFGKLSVRIDDQAMVKDSAYWQSQRPTPLSKIDALTYHKIDSLGRAENFDRYLTVSEKLLQGKWPFKYFDLDLCKTLIYNKYEGFRLGTGIGTNEAISKKVSFGAFAGYGLKDNDWKFGGHGQFNVSPETSISIRYERNLCEIGSYGMKSFADDIYNLRNLIGYRYDLIRLYNVNFKTEPLRYLQMQFSLAHTEITPKYAQGLTSINEHSHYATSTMALYFRYAFAEKKISFFGGTFNMKSDFPVLQFLVKKGFRNVLDGDLNFLRLELSAEQTFFTKNIGLTQYRINAGYIDAPLPVGQLFTGEGAYDDTMALVVKNHFQTMRPYEFVSDRFIHLFFTHNFGALLFRSRHFSPDISVLHNLGWGHLSSTAAVGSEFQLQQDAFLECGLRLDNIVKLNYMNLGYLGLGGAGFYRYGAYSLPKTSDNFIFKIALTFSIR